jgi:hypothetical protein
MQLIEIKIIPQPMDDDFNARMDEAHRQQRVALEAQLLLHALKCLVTSPQSTMFQNAAREAVRRAEGA